MLVRLKRLKRGFTLVELMIVVAIVGILAALAVYGVNRYMTSAKSAEAKEMLGRIAKDAVLAYDREIMAGEILDGGSSATGSHQLCASASAVPSGNPPKGAKYQSKVSDWLSGSQSAGWQCLKFSISGPQYYQYNYTQSGTAFTAIARGDLDGDGSSFSTFKLQGAQRGSTATFSPNFIELNPEE